MKKSDVCIEKAVRNMNMEDINKLEYKKNLSKNIFRGVGNVILESIKLPETPLE